MRCRNVLWYNQIADSVTTPTMGCGQLRRHAAQPRLHRGQPLEGQARLRCSQRAAQRRRDLRGEIFYHTLGRNYIKFAFEEAARADPTAELSTPANTTLRIRGQNKRPWSGWRKCRRRPDSGSTASACRDTYFMAGETPTIGQRITATESHAALGVEVAQTELGHPHGAVGGGGRIPHPAGHRLRDQRRRDFDDAASTGFPLGQRQRFGRLQVMTYYIPTARWHSCVPSALAGQGVVDLRFANHTKHPACKAIENHWVQTN